MSVKRSFEVKTFEKEKFIMLESKLFNMGHLNSFFTGDDAVLVKTGDGSSQLTWITNLSMSEVILHGLVGEEWKASFQDLNASKRINTAKDLNKKYLGQLLKLQANLTEEEKKRYPLDRDLPSVSYTHLTLPTNRE